LTIFFTSDTHFGHKKIIEYCNRPFADVHEMNEELIKRWNEKVGPDDIVYHLGDFAFMPKSRIVEIIERLNGKIVLIMGNHDAKGIRKLFHGWHKELLLSLEVNGMTELFLSHYPIDHECGLVLCGHVHNAWKVGSFSGNPVINVGVDVWDYYPVSIEEIRDLKMPK